MGIRDLNDAASADPVSLWTATAALAAAAEPAAHASVTFTPFSKTDQGGYLPKPLRVPTLAIDREFPIGANTHRPVWTDTASSTVYGYGRDARLYKSTDMGDTWTALGFPSGGIGNNAFLKLTSGALLWGDTSATMNIVRSANDGATSAPVQAMRAGTVLMGTQSWAQDPNTGYIYFGEYQSVDTIADIRVWRSTDDGATWSTWYTFPGPTGGTAATRVRHIHSVQYDPISARVYVLVGDSELSAGIYRVNAGGTTLEPVVLNSYTSLPSTSAGRTIGLMCFPNYLAWASDDPANPNIYRMNRSQIGSTTPVVTQVYRINGSGWFTTRAADDSTRWLVSASNETGTGVGRLDASSHLYSVEDDGATVYEVASIASEGSAYAVCAPVGSPGIHGDVFWLQGRGFDVDWAIKARIARSGSAAVTKPRLISPVPSWVTQASGSLSVGASAQVVFGNIRVPVATRVLYIYDFGVKVISGTGSPALKLVNAAGGATIGSINANWPSAKVSLAGDAAPWLYRITAGFSASDDLSIAIQEQGGVNPVVATGYLVYGWGAS
jgi:hypothetical protein